MSTWHSQPTEEVLQTLGTTLSGLPPEHVAAARSAGGTNALPPPPQKHSWEVFVDQFKSPLIIILLVASAISFAVKEWQDALVVVAVVIINATIGWRQERGASAAMSQLLKLSPQIVHVIRGDAEVEIPADDIVIGDIVIMETGAAVPADGRWVEARNLRLNESSLTGESIPVSKMSEALPEHTPTPDQHNMGWRGTLVVGGRGRLVVTAVGANTRFGAIVVNLQTIEEVSTPFQKKLGSFSQRLAALTFIIGGLVFLLGIVRGLEFEQVLLLSVSLIVSIIPEGLPVVITVAMAYGMWAMARRQAIVRKLTAVETLGSVTVVATDKTGTLTYGEMMAAKVLVEQQTFHFTGEGYRSTGDIFLDSKPVVGSEHLGLSWLTKIAALNNDGRFTTSKDGNRAGIGDPTELALVVAAEKVGWHKPALEAAHPRRGEIPFDHKVKYMVTWHDMEHYLLVTLKGAPQEVLALCKQQFSSSGSRELTDDDRHKILGVYEQWATESLRGLAVAYCTLPSLSAGVSMEELAGKFIFVGLFGLEDALRPEAAATIAELRQAGIRTIMMTGDYQRTGQAVAERLGLLTGGGSGMLLDGHEIDGLDDAALRARLATTRVATRLTPEHKFRLATLLRADGQVVAMTGDGINDVPALVEADVGVAVGRQSSDAAKEAAEMVLVDGNFQSLTAAIAEGRRIFRNIQRVMFYLLASNFGGLILIVVTMLIGLPLPLLPTQIIWLNAVTDPFLGVALAREPMSPSIMKEKPHDPRSSIIRPGGWQRIMLNAVAIAAGTLAVFMIALESSRSSREVFAVTLTALALGEWATGLAARSTRRSLFGNLGSNQILMIAFLGVIAMQAAILYIPFLAEIFHVAPLSLGDWGLATLGAWPIIIADEIRKWWIRRQYQVPALHHAKV